MTRILSLSLLFSLPLLAACNTIEGVGEDIQHGGQAIERTAEDTKTY